MISTVPTKVSSFKEFSRFQTKEPSKFRPKNPSKFQVSKSFHKSKSKESKNSNKVQKNRVQIASAGINLWTKVFWVTKFLNKVWLSDKVFWTKVFWVNKVRLSDKVFAKFGWVNKVLSSYGCWVQRHAYFSKLLSVSVCCQDEALAQSHPVRLPEVKRSKSDHKFSTSVATAGFQQMFTRPDVSTHTATSETATSMLPSIQRPKKRMRTTIFPVFQLPSRSSPSKHTATTTCPKTPTFLRALFPYPGLQRALFP